MAYRYEKDTGDVVIDGFDKGIASSPHNGLANIQNANIATEGGEIINSFARVKDNPQAAISGGTLTASPGDGTTKLAAPSTLYGGQQINITATNITTTATSAAISYLVVAGGGGGGGGISASTAGGGGGAGGLLAGTSTVIQRAYAITVGTGGNGQTGSAGNNGTDSIIGALINVDATGGGGGSWSTTVGANGGSGGGGGKSAANGTGTVGQGHDGGAGTGAQNTGAGGGGASTAGVAVTTNVGTAGGAGTASSISGSSVTYAGGGGGGGLVGTAGGAGGAGGGGAGGSSGAIGSNATANRGSGGGGGASNNASGGNGSAGVVIISYTTGDLTATGGTITTSGGNTIHTFTSTGTFTVTAITKSITLPTGNYYVSYKDGSNKVKISYFYDPYGLNPIVHGTSGTATFNTVAIVGNPIAKSTESYQTATGSEYRYYILNSSGYIWVYDTAVYTSTLAATGTGVKWMLPDPTDYSSNKFTGMANLNGWLMALSTLDIVSKPTTNLGTAFSASIATLMNPFPTHTNFAYVGHQGRMYWCDGNYIGSMFPDTSTLTGGGNVQSYASYTASTTTGTITSIIDGSLPTDLTTHRIPAVFFTDQNGTQPDNLTVATVYYIGNLSGSTFQVFAASSGGSAIDISAGASGNQYYNTFYPIGGDAGSGGIHATVVVSQQRLNLPFFEQATCMTEIGNTIIIGCKSNSIYPWDQRNVLPGTVISLPETNTQSMVTVNQMAYIFAGNNANIYITDGNVASAVTTVPDYVAGIPGTPSSYIEPYFIYGDSMYVAGRVYFSVLDQTVTKAGNAGGIWSFIPTQNLYIGEDVGLSLRLEAQNSYGTYNGYCPILIPNQTQIAVGPQYWSAWNSSLTSPTYGIDMSGTGTTSTSVAVVETDAIPTGTMLQKKTFSQIEFKLATPLLATDSIVITYRKDLTSAWQSCGTAKLEGNRLSGYFSANFEKTQWLQLQVTLTSGTSSSFVRLSEIRIR